MERIYVSLSAKELAALKVLLGTIQTDPNYFAENMMPKLLMSEGVNTPKKAKLLVRDLYNKVGEHYLLLK